MFIFIQVFTKHEIVSDEGIISEKCPENVRKPDKNIRTLVKFVRKREKVSGVTTIRLRMQILIVYSHSYSEEYECFHNIISHYSYLAKITFHSNRVQQQSHKRRFIYELHMKLCKSVLNTEKLKVKKFQPKI